MVIYTSEDQTERLYHLPVWVLEDRTACFIIAGVVKDNYLQKF